VTSVERPRPLGSLLASAQRLTRRSIGRANVATGWQDDAWTLFDEVGELHFLATTLAGRGGNARIYVGEIGDDPTEAPTPVDDPNISGVLDAVGDSSNARTQMIVRLLVNLFITGGGWLVGVPRWRFPASLLPAEPDPFAPRDETLEWRMLSVNEVSSGSTGDVTLRFGPTEAEKVLCSPDDVFLIRVWRPHPRHWWEADSPTRAVLPILRELVALTQYVSALTDSRLTGAGAIIFPESASRALRVSAGLGEDDPTDPLSEAFIETAAEARRNQDSAAAKVAIVLNLPDEACALVRHITFAVPLDAEARPLREEAIRRLALGLDAPPEVLLGSGSTNHWTGWLVDEQVVTTHLAPPLALICDALTTQYLWPVLVQQGKTEEEARRYVIWFDVSDLIIRPSHSQDAFALHAVGAISDEALRNATGFDDTDKPEEDALHLPLEVTMAIELVKGQPALAANPGLPGLVAQFRAVLHGDIPIVETPVAQIPEKNGQPQSKAPAIGPKPIAVGAPSLIPQTDQAPPAAPTAAAMDREMWVQEASR
jgi:hypothetical protein